jgi:hypothetical protein
MWNNPVFILVYVKFLEITTLQANIRFRRIKSYQELNSELGLK